jgi:bile acid-coenzyme A ligase
MTGALPLGVHFSRLAQTMSGLPAVSADDGERTWATLNARANRLARELAKTGVRFGDFVTIALPNSVRFVEACIACWKIGAVPQPVSPKLPEAEFKAIVLLANPPIVIADDMADLGRPVISVETLIAGEKDDGDLPPVISPSWKAPTSGGSTGRPKLIVSGAPAVFEPNSLLFWRLGAGDVALIPAPLYHNGPFGCAFAALTAGAHLVITPKFSPAATLELVERKRATWLYLVPTMMNRIWRLPAEERAAYDLSSLHTVWHMAAPCPPWLKEAWIEWLGAEKIWELYGGTEAQSVTAINGREWLGHRGSVGRPALGEMRIFDDQGNERPLGEKGEVFMRRAAGSPETYRYIGAEARTLGDWESLGDIGWMDEDGYLYLADRRTDMVLVGGANIYPAEIEAALDEHPLVQSSAVIGLPDDDLGNIIHAIVQPRPGLDLDELRHHLSERLVVQKLPRSFELVDVPLRDDAGKVRRSQLRAERMRQPPSESR